MKRGRFLTVFTCAGSADTVTARARLAEHVELSKICRKIIFEPPQNLYLNCGVTFLLIRIT